MKMADDINLVSECEHIQCSCSVCVSNFCGCVVNDSIAMAASTKYMYYIDLYSVHVQ